MAYRDFHYEKQYEAPDLTQSAHDKVQGISNIFSNIKKDQEAKKTLANQFDYDLDKGEFENDTKILTEVAKNVTGRAKNELLKTGKLSTDTERLMKDGLSWQQQSKNQNDRAKALRQNINDRAGKDSYYNPQQDLNLVQEATHGKDNDIDFRTRGDRLSEAEKKVGGIDSFKFNNYRADYVKGVGAQYKESTSGTPNAKSTIYNQATFWDKKTGKPGVTDDHAIDFLQSDERVTQYYDDKVSKELDSEIKKMKSSGDSRTSWMNGKTDEEIKSTLINDPSKNLVNKQDYGIRIRQSAKDDLSEADRINTKVSYDTSADKNNSGGRWKNNNILHDESINSFAQQAKSLSTGQYEPVTTFGPGGSFTQRNGRPIQIDTQNPVRTNINKGITTKNNKGSVRLNMLSYQLMPIKKSNAPYALKANTPDQMIQEINNIPLEYFDPNGNVALQPELKIGMNGYTINEAGVLNDVNDKLFNIADQLHEADSKGDKEKQASLQNMEYSLNEVRDMIDTGGYSDNDLLMAAQKAGIRKVQDNWIIPADDADISNIKNITGGFNLKDESYWSPEMKDVQSAYKKRASEAAAQGYGRKKEEKPAVTKKPESKTVAPAKKQIKRADISAKAQASGYTAAEYEALLKKNGVTITE